MRLTGFAFGLYAMVVTCFKLLSWMSCLTTSDKNARSWSEVMVQPGPYLGMKLVSSIRLTVAAVALRTR